MTRLRALLQLGRVSNLPTVWTNVVAGCVLAGGDLEPARSGLLLGALSLFYVGGMYLNDAFDREIDARERPERPIPAGVVSARSVFAAGGAMLAAGVALLALAGGRPAAGGLALAGAIVAYDRSHKGNPAAPLVMGLCRVLVYAVAALAAVGALPGAVVFGAALLFAHVLGLTYIARQENRERLATAWPLLLLALPFAAVAATTREWSAPLLGCYALAAAWTAWALSHLLVPARLDVRAGVSLLIAGIALLDAVLVARAGHAGAALACLAAAPLTRAAQRSVPGT